MLDITCDTLISLIYVYSASHEGESCLGRLEVNEVFPMFVTVEFFSSVNLFMPWKRTGTTEGFPTFFTFVGLLSSVRPFMSSKSTTPEGFATLFTLKRPLTSVCYFMTYHTGRNEGFPTFFACLVSLQNEFLIYSEGSGPVGSFSSFHIHSPVSSVHGSTDLR